MIYQGQYMDSYIEIEEMLRPHFLDSSVLVKLVIHEPGSDVLRQYFGSHSWFVTSPLCISEAINVVKRKRGKLTDEQCFAALWELLWPFRGGSKIQLTRENMSIR